MNQTGQATVNILIVEDNLADVVLFQEAMEAGRISAHLDAVTDGGAALRFLRRQEPYQRAVRPDVIVLDLNLPVKNGQEVLAEIVADGDLSDIPVAILTTSLFDDHLPDLHLPGRCLYFSKTDSLDELQDIVRRIEAHARGALS